MASSDLVRDLTGTNRKANVVAMAAAEGNSRRTGRAIVSSILMMTSDIVAVLLALVVSLYLGAHSLGHLMTGVGISMPGGIGYLLWFIVTLLVVSWHYGLYGP